MKIGLFVWWLAPVLGLVSIALSLFVGNKSLFAIASYTDALPTFYFLAATTSAVACAEAAEFFLLFDRKVHDATVANRVSAQLFVCIIATLVWVCVYAKLQADVSAGQLVASGNALFLALVFTIMTVVIGFSIKRDLEAIRNGGPAS